MQLQMFNNGVILTEKNCIYTSFLIVQEFRIYSNFNSQYTSTSLARMYDHFDDTLEVPSSYTKTVSLLDLFFYFLKTTFFKTDVSE